MHRHLRFWPAGFATLLTATVVGLTLLATPTPVAGTLCQPTLSVTTLVDYDPGSLRSAIAQVCTGGTITFAVNGTMHLTSASSPLVVDRDMTISGPGADHLTIDGSGAVQIFQIGGAQVNLSGLTLQNGSGSNGGAMLVVSGSVAITDTVIMSSTATSGGGGIYNAGTLTLTNVALSSNHETSIAGGGGLHNEGTAALFNVQFLSNSAIVYGGGLMNPGSLSMNNVVIQNNTAPYAAGIMSGGVLTGSNTSVVSNIASAYGGGVWNDAGSLVLTNSAVISNSATSGGVGGIQNNSGVMTLTNVTVSGNASTVVVGPVLAPRAPLAVTRIGGISTSGAAALTNVTIANNAALDGGGIYVWAGPAVLTNTLLADNGGGNCAGTISSGGHNLDSADSCIFRATGDLTMTNPLLGPLANNGGPTLTQALPRGSPAIDHGTNIGCSGTDQRGMRRPFDGDYDSNALCDIGAFEYNVPMLFLPLVLK